MKKIILLSYVLLSFIGLSACSGLFNGDSLTHKIQVPPVSVQLWSVKDALQKDFKGTLQQLADMGFQGVEFAGNYGEYAEDPTGLKNYLASIGLKASGAHMGFQHLRGDKLEENLVFLKALGVELVIVPADSRAWSADGVHALTEDLTTLSQTLASKQMIMGYHNHDKEFNDYKGATFWDYIAQNTPQNVLLQLDVGWVNYAGKDPIEYVKRYAGRTLTTHIKIRTYTGPSKNVKGAVKSPIIGEDDFDWAALIKAQVEFGSTRWLVLEQEEYPEGLSSMQSVQKSKLGLDKIISQL